MRPVEKGNPPGGFAGVSLATVSTDLDLDKALDKLGPWTFTSTDVQNLFKTAAPSVTRVLHALLVYAGGEDPPPDPVKVGLVNQLLTNHEEVVYKAAGPMLLKLLGKYCCYCEMHQGAEIDVEHVIPKAQYPLFSIAWENLLLACTVCNRHNKGVKPLRADMDTWGQAYGAPFKTPPGQEVARYKAVRDYYLWPDTLETAAYTDLQPVLEYQLSPTTWKAVPKPKPFDVGNDMKDTDSDNRMVTASLAKFLSGKAVPVRVNVRPSGTNKVRAANFVAMVGLEKDGTAKADKQISDTRMFERTQAWFNILKQLRLVVMTAASGDAKTFEIAWAAMISATHSFGFFSLWLTIIEGIGGAVNPVPGSNPPVLIKDRFLADVNTSKSFPNTLPGL